MTHPFSAVHCRRWISGILAVMIGLGPLATPTYAALTKLADEPLNVQNKAQPNVMLTVDDSTSMLFDFLPDSVVGTFCRDITGKMGAACGTSGQNTDLTGTNRGKYVTPGFVFEQYGMPFGLTNPAYDASGPGAGCLFTPAGSATCSGGIPPGVLPGLDVYPNPPGPPPAKSPKAGQPYEYWTLWPAPAHNGAFNHAYYDPRLTYVPPVHADGTDYPQMNAANTAGWTHVPADPWAASVQYVDLTAKVTVGLWCNSDWSVGNENNPSYCRTNGTGTGAATSSGSSPDGDYNYPWAPPGIDPLGPVAVGSPTIAKSIAYSKVDGTGALKPAWATAQDPKYFYENDNILWCDTTSPLWPQSGPTVSQTCIGSASVPQTCINRHEQTCPTGTPQSCIGATPDSCAGVQTQTCGALAAQTCGGSAPQTCNPPPTQTCSPTGPQTCDGIVAQTCVNVAGQTCNNVQHQTCNLVAPSCVPPDPTTCTTTSWLVNGVPDTGGVCPCVGGECPVCTPVVTCPQGTCSSAPAQHCDTAATCPSAGTCSFVGNPCTGAAGDCPTQPGICSRDGAPGCFVDGDCAHAGNCSTQVVTACHTAGVDPAECPTVPGHCTLDGNACHTAGTDLAECPTQPGHCTSDGLGCFADHPDCDRSSTCSVTGAACTTSCPAAGGRCSIDGVACTSSSDCGMAGTCSRVGNACHVTGSDPSECVDLPGACVVSHAACTGAVTDCPPLPNGHCSSSGVACSTIADCPNAGQVCTGPGGVGGTGEACSPTPYVTECTYVPGTGGAPPVITNCSEPSYCPILNGVCDHDLSPCPYTAQLGWNIDPVTGASWGYLFGATWNYAYDLSACNNAVTLGHCSIDTATPCSSPTDPVCAPRAGPSGSASCSDMLADSSRSLLEDANGPGRVCRHNNRAGGYSSGPYDYPNAKFNTPVTAGTGPNACVASPRYATVPRHYWKTSVEWCDHAVVGAVAATPKWLGYGDRSAGTCQDDQDVPNNFIYPRFYQFGQPAVTDNVAIPAFQRLDLDPVVNPSFDHGLDPFGDPIHRDFGGATPDVSEMTNYANWYAYYRTRITAVKTVTSLAFKEIDSKYRVGFHTLVDYLSNVPPRDIPPVFLNVGQFDDASAAHQKPTWYSKLFGVTIPLGNETPSLQALVRIGEYYKTGSHPRLIGAVDPIILSCSKNYHLFFTDGYTNENGIPADVVVADQDNKVPAYPYVATAPISGLTPGAAWPHPFQEDVASGLTQNALSDYAMYYWVTDLQHSGPAAHNVLATDTDPATWQHQNFAAVSLGTKGKLATAQQSVTEAALTAGTLQWPVPSPSVFHPDNSGVDDLWHAAINGRGQFVNAQSVDEVKLGIGQVLADIAAQAGSRAGAGLQSTSVGASSNFIYRAKFEPGWAGSLTKEQIDPHTGLKVAEVWKAATQLAAQLAVGAAPNDKPWFTNRKIVTMNEAGVAVPFLYDSLGAEQRDSLFPPNTLSKVAREKAIIEFLRGNAANEGTKLGQFRKRKAFLGDIVDTSPVYVGVQPNAAYRDGDDPGYSTFKATTPRPAQVYVSANDGMLHAFNDANGNETWAYIPSPLYRGGLESFRILEDPLAGDAKAGLGALTYQTGALPPFKHHYMVDGPLKVVDVDFGGEHWHTILVGGMGKGGNRYFALDVTNPADITNEATAASKVLWEFSAPQMGFTYGKPMIAKTKAFGGTWLVIVASGYNNADGHGYLYFIRASDGTLMKTMTTKTLDAGSAGTPSGLAHPAGYTQDFRNQLAEQIYAGDLLGDFWRFDISDADDSHWTVGKMARLVDPSDNPQPVTTPPNIEVDASNGVDRWVFVGTGKLYDDSDLTDHQVQTMYAFRDGTQTAPVAFPDPSFPLSRHTSPGMQLLPHTLSTKFGLASKPANGWYDDLPGGAASQRIVVPPQAAITVVAYVGTSPQTDPCLTGQTANIYAREFATGATVLFNGGGTALESVASAEGAVGLEIVGFDTAPGASQPDIRLAITLGTTGEVTFVNVTLPPNVAGHRMSWRLLGQ